MDKRLQIVLVGLVYLRVGGVHPFYGKLEGLAAAHGAHGGTRRQRALCFDARIREKLIVWKLFEEREVHDAPPSI